VLGLALHDKGKASMEAGELQVGGGPRGTFCMCVVLLAVSHPVCSFVVLLQMCVSDSDKDQDNRQASTRAGLCFGMSARHAF
jgi:hypothetical protein